MAELSGRTALITGAGQNVGAETARVLAGHGARVIVNDLFEDRADMRLRQLRAYSVPRLGAPGDVAAAIAWLTSDSGSWVTGQTIPVNGGYASS